MAKKKLLMTLGPVQMHEATLALGAQQVPYPRTPEYSAWYAGINENLQYLFQTRRHVYTVTCSGTGVLQMAVDNLCARGVSVLTFATGTFGRRWGEIARAAGACVAEVPVESGRNVTPALLAATLENHPEAKIVFLTANETSTTARADIQGCAAVLRETDKILVVDAVSALGAEQLLMDEWGIDVLLTSSQKALALPPGLGFIAFSEKAWKVVLSHPCRSYYFDARAYEKDWGRNQPPFTPALAVILQLRERLEAIKAEGLETIQKKCAERSDYFRAGLLKLGFVFPSQPMANGTTAVRVPSNVDANELADKMRREKNIVLVPPYPGGDTLRIGNLGAISKDDIDSCLNSLAEALAELRADQ